MSPPLTYAMQQALKRDRAAIVLLAEIEHPDGTAHVWSGIGSLDYNGETWRGAGVLGTISPITHTSTVIVQEIQFTLVGTDTETMAGLSDDVRNRSGKVWLACLDVYGNIVPDPYLIVDSSLDFQSMKISEEGQNILQITARTGFHAMDRALDDRWTPEDQKTVYPDDSGLDLISALQNQSLIWAP